MFASRHGRVFFGEAVGADVAEGLRMLERNMEGMLISNENVPKALAQWELGVKLSRKPHSPHVQNFIEAVQMNKPAHLTCNVVDAFKSCVTVLKAYESIQNGGKYIFKPEDFEA